MDEGDHMDAGIHPPSLRPKDSLRAALAAVGLAALIFPTPAAAYVDPLSGSLIFQALAAGVLSFIFTARRSVHWLGERLNAVRSVFRRR